MKTTKERGETHHSAKLTTSNVRWIRLNKGKLSLREMGRKFDVHFTAIQHVLNGISWKHVDQT